MPGRQWKGESSLQNESGGGIDGGRWLIKIAGNCSFRIFRVVETLCAADPCLVGSIAKEAATPNKRRSVSPRPMPRRRRCAAAIQVRSARV